MTEAERAESIQAAEEIVCHSIVLTEYGDEFNEVSAALIARAEELLEILRRKSDGSRGTQRRGEIREHRQVGVQPDAIQSTDPEGQ
jgi:hypothetical protein